MTFTKEKREDIERALVSIERGGRLTPERVVHAAKNPKNPMHDYFEWDDSVAATLHRIEQARTLIRSVQVQVTTDTSVIQSVRYVRDQSVDSNDQGYISIEQLRDEPENAKAIMKHEWSNAQAYIARAERLAEVLGVLKEVQQISKRAKVVRKKIEEAVLV